MTPKRVCVFTADFPNDFVVEGRKIALMGGRTAAQEIRRIVGRLGPEISELDYFGFPGWGFVARFKDGRYACNIQSFYPMYYLTFFLVPRRDHGPEKDQEYAALWSALATALEADARFHDVKWYPTFKDAPRPPGSWFGWELGAHNPPGVLARYVARPLGWFCLVLAVLAFFESTPAPISGAAYLLAGLFLLSIGHKAAYLFGVRLPWVRLP